MLTLSNVCPFNSHAKKGNCLLICLHYILFFHNQGSISRSQSILPLKEKTDTNYFTSTVVPRLEVKKKKAIQDNVERAKNTGTGREIRETIQMSYIQLSATGRKAHVLKTVLQSHRNKQSYWQGLEELRSLRHFQFHKIRDFIFEKQQSVSERKKIKK